MTLFRTIRRNHIRAVLGLLLAWSLAPMANFTQSLNSALHAKTEIQRTDIGAGKITLDFCLHHPEGCPKDCLCPKTHSRTVISLADQGENGSLFQPVLVECTASHSIASFQASLDFLPDAGMVIPEFQFILDRLAMFLVPDPREPCLIPPQKIPIA